MSRLPPRVVVQLHPIHTGFDAVLGIAREIERMGADGLYVSDHFLPVVGDPAGVCFESWTTVAAIARETERIEIGVLASGNDYRNPHLVSLMAKTVDAASRGRFSVGLGAGWWEEEYRDFGYEFRDDAQRQASLEASVEVVHRRLGAEGGAGARRVPIMIGGGGLRKDPEVIARWADAWIDYAPLEVASAMNERIDRACDRAGRERTAVSRGIALGVGETAADAVRCLEHGFDTVLLEVVATGQGLDELRDTVSAFDRAHARP